MEENLDPTQKQKKKPRFDYYSIISIFKKMKENILRIRTIILWKYRVSHV